MTKSIKILSGSYKIRGKDVELAGMVFPLVEEFKVGAQGGYVTVDGSAVAGFPDRNIKIKVNSSDDYESTRAAVTKREETDEETIERIRERFDILEDMTRACKKGDVRAMIVTGPPGVGKSFGVETVLEDYDMLTEVAGKPRRTEVVKGSVTPIGLFQTLFNNSDKGNILVFDDCDSVLFDEVCLNMLKATLDSGKKRYITWKSESNALRREGIPDRFEFKGGCIFITNVDFENVRSKKIKDHLAALMSRCHYLDLTMSSARDKFLRIKQIVRDGMLEEYKFGADGDKEIIDFMLDNADKLREISLRMVLKISDLRKMDPANWQSLARTTCMKGSI